MKLFDHWINLGDISDQEIVNNIQREQLNSTTSLKTLSLTKLKNFKFYG